MPDQRLKIRLKLTNGAEFEAEGETTLVLREKERFLRIGIEKPIAFAGNTNAAAAQEPADTGSPAAMWPAIAEHRNGIIWLKRKHPAIGAPEAAVVITAAAKLLAQLTEYPALQLSKSLKKSGYFQGRLDRIIGQEVKNGLLTALGSKRSRSYSITPKGLARAFVLGEKLLS